MRRSSIAIGMLAIGFAVTAFAQNDSLAPFRKYLDISRLAISVPTVIEVPLQNARFERSDFAVLNKTKGTFEPWLLIQKTAPSKYRASVQGKDGAAMVDGNADTYTEFEVPETGVGKVEIVLTSDTPVTSSELTALLDVFVALPLTVEIHARKVANALTTVVAERKMDSNIVRFPKTTSDVWFVKFTYSQPLRIGELRLADERVKDPSRAIRFLAQSESTYRVYFDPDRPARVTTAEAPNLSSSEDVMVVGEPSVQENSEYVIADSDQDGVADIRDNCVQIANADQVDVNANGRGDACDDFDKDGLINSKDNCPMVPNREQADTDSDSIGDACDDAESRITEKYSWVPWLGMGAAAVVLVGLIIVMMKKPKSPSSGGPEVH